MPAFNALIGTCTVAPGGMVTVEGMVTIAGLLDESPTVVVTASGGLSDTITEPVEFGSMVKSPGITTTVERTTDTGCSVLFPKLLIAWRVSLPVLFPVTSTKRALSTCLILPTVSFPFDVMNWLTAPRFCPVMVSVVRFPSNSMEGDNPVITGAPVTDELLTESRFPTSS